MARYIDADALLEQVNKKKSEVGKQRYTDGFNDAISRVRSMISSCATSDVVKAMHGEWILEKEPNGNPYCFHCSVCDDEFRRIDIKVQTPYCPHCGARMDGERSKP